MPATRKTSSPAGAAPGPSAMLSPAQMHALRRSDRLTSAECNAHRERTRAEPGPRGQS